MRATCLEHLLVGHVKVEVLSDGSRNRGSPISGFRGPVDSTGVPTPDLVGWFEDDGPRSYGVPVGIHRMQNGHAMGAALALEEDFAESMSNFSRAHGFIGLKIKCA